MKKILLAAIVIALAGCASGPVLMKNPKGRVHETATFEVHIVEKLPVQNSADAVTLCAHGRDSTGTLVQIKNCRIYIKASVYPRCLAHEIRHVFEGDWHPRQAKIKGDKYREDC